MLFVFYGFEPPDCGGGVFPLVEVGCSHDSAVNSVKDSFAEFSYLRFGGVDQPAGQIYIYIYMVLSSKINHLCLIIFSKRIEHMFEPELKTAFLAYTIFRLRSSHVSSAINDKGFVLFLPLLIASKRRLTVSFFAWQNPNA